MLIFLFCFHGFFSLKSDQMDEVLDLDKDQDEDQNSGKVRGQSYFRILLYLASTPI